MFSTPELGHLLYMRLGKEERRGMRDDDVED
jgi:hypothetical protein